MKILALDPSSTHVGYCLALDGDYQLSGVFTPKGNADARVKAILTWAWDVLRAHLPGVVVLEEPAANNAHRNAKTDRILARVGGVLEAVALLCEARVARVYPSQVKATGCSKDALFMAAAIAGKPVGEDEADAIGVWLAYGVQQ